MIGGALLGALLTVLAGSEPGIALGVFVVAGTVAAALAVQPRSAHLIVPVPALAYLVMAAMAGLIHDRGADGSSTALAVNLAQWIASGFVAIVAATALAIAIAILRRPKTTLDSAYSPPYRGYSPPAGRSGRSHRAEDAQSPPDQRPPERDFDHPPAPAFPGPRDAGRYGPRDPVSRDANRYERWYRTDSR